jgi:uncharacterized glyoxalase superfamily protein PhnB
MLTNRSIPRSTVIPEFAYPDVTEAAAWLCEVFGFTVRIRIGNHRVQLNVGDGAMVVTEQSRSAGPDADGASPGRDVPGHSVIVRVPDANAQYERTRKHGAKIVRPIQDYPYGERQFTVEDFAGHRWTFSQSIADVDPADWGGTAGKL